MVCLLSAVLLVGCAQKEAPEQAEEGIPTIAVEDHHSYDGVLRVGISMPSSSLERWNHDGEFLKKHLENEGYEVRKEKTEAVLAVWQKETDGNPFVTM